MPGYITHYLFGNKAFINMPDCKVKDCIEAYPNSYKLGLQGPDIFYFHIPSLIGDGHKNLGSLMHKGKVNRFFHKYLRVMEHLDQDNKDIALSFLAGYLCHYYLDTACHPFIYARTNYSLDENIESFLYYANHRTLETEIDTMMLEHCFHKKPSKFPAIRNIRLSKKEKSLVSYILSYTINKTFYKYGDANFSKTANNKNKKRNRTYLEQIYYRRRFHINPSLKVLLPFENVISAHFIQRVIGSVNLGCKLLYDKTGNKRRIMKEIEDRTVHYDLLTSLMPKNNFIDTKDCLNKKKEAWRSPWDPTLQKRSFLSLYHRAIRLYRKNIQLLNAYALCNHNALHQSIDPNKEPACEDIYQLRNKLLNHIGNKSYHSGLEVIEDLPEQLYETNEKLYF